MSNYALQNLWEDYKYSVESYTKFQTEENMKIMKLNYAALIDAFTGGVTYQ